MRMWATLLLIVAALCVVPAPALARDGGTKWIGLGHDLIVEGAFGRGSRWGGAGNQLLLRFEGAAFGKVSSLGNLAGLEFGTLLGYDGAKFKATDGLLGEGSMIPFEMSVGFPVTLFHWMSGREGRVLLGIAPGFGFNWISAFTYLKAKGAIRLAPNLVAEAQWTWWPGAASAPFGDKEERAVNAAQLRATVYVGMGRGKSIAVFAEAYRSQREQQVFRGGGGATATQGGNASSTLYGGKDPFGAIVRHEFEDFLRFGVGYAF